MTKIYACFSGSGKTYYASHTSKSVVDLESTFFRYKNMTEKTIEQLKGNKDRELNPNFVSDYIAAIQQKIAENIDVLFISQHDDVLHQLDKLNIKYTIVFYEPNMLDECIKRCRNRGNSEDFINGIKDNWTNFCEKYITENYILLSADKPYISSYLD